MHTNKLCARRGSNRERNITIDTHDYRENYEETLVNSWNQTDVTRQIEEKTATLSLMWRTVNFSSYFVIAIRRGLDGLVSREVSEGCQRFVFDVPLSGTSACTPSY